MSVDCFQFAEYF